MLLLGRLAVVESHQGKGLGSILLADTLQRIALASCYGAGAPNPPYVGRLRCVISYRASGRVKIVSTASR